MADAKTKSIPEWQRLGAADDKKNDDGDRLPEATESRQEILERAADWLKHDDIRDAPTDKKIAFLEEKGLTSDEIQELIGVERNAEASGPAPVAESSTAAEAQTSLANPVPDQQAVSPRESAPPIITYPEFLVHASRPAPLVTKTRLLNTFYATALAAGALRITSKHLVEPMLESLASARHDLYSSASNDLSQLNKKLEGVVSSVPPTFSQPRPRSSDVGYDSDDSDASDPSELFHRDAGVQTSTPPPSSPDTEASPFSPTTSQTAKLKSIRSQLADLLPLSYNNISPEDSALRVLDGNTDAKAAVDELSGYLDDLRFSRARWRAGAGQWDSNLKQFVSSGSQKDQDEVEKVKAEIRSFKGTLLSSKSFPRGGR